MDEAKFLTRLVNIVKENGCEIKEIDLKKRILNIKCPKNNDVACAIALADAFEEYDMDGKKNETVHNARSAGAFRNYPARS